MDPLIAGTYELLSLARNGDLEGDTPEEFFVDCTFYQNDTDEETRLVLRREDSERLRIGQLYALTITAV